MNVRAAVLYEVKRGPVVEEITLDDPQQGEVLVKMAATGICHTDLHVIKGDTPNLLPVVMGHEGAGIVEKVGPGVTAVQPGDHVVLLAISPCGTCRYCVEGQPALCQSTVLSNFSGSLYNGGKRLHKGNQELNHFYGQSSFAEYAVAHERTLVKVRKDAPLDVVCLFGCGVSTGVGAVLNRSGIKAGESIVIYGCGGVGLSSVMGARLAGAGKLIAVDVLDSKLAKARELGADYVINAARENPQQRVMEITGGGADYSIESIGNVKVMAQAFASIHNAGTCILVGIPPMTDMLSVFPFELLLGKTLKGSVLGNIRASIDIPRWVDLYMAGKLPVDKLISRYYSLDEINEGFAAMERGETIRSAVRF